jgi:hypothetical protein
VYLVIPLTALMLGIYAVRDGSDLLHGREIKTTEAQL